MSTWVAGRPLDTKSARIENVQLPRANMNLKLLMPERVEIPPDAQQFGAKYVEFRPGHHAVDLYRDLDSPRLMHTTGSLPWKKGSRPSTSRWKRINFPQANMYSESAAIRSLLIAH
jgi:hypothetical protein